MVFDIIIVSCVFMKDERAAPQNGSTILDRVTWFEAEEPGTITPHA